MLTDPTASLPTAAAGVELEVLRERRDWAQAWRISRARHDANPHDFWAAWNALHDGSQQCDWTRHEFLQTVVAECVAHSDDASLVGELALATPKLTPPLLLESARRHMRWLLRGQASTAPLVAPGHRYPNHRRLRIGYIGGDFHY